MFYFKGGGAKLNKIQDRIQHDLTSNFPQGTEIKIFKPLIYIRLFRWMILNYIEKFFKITKKKVNNAEIFKKFI